VQAGLRDAYQSLAQARAMMAAQRDLEQTATATFEAVRKAFVAGLRTNLDLLNAQQQIYTARQSQVSARVSALTAYCNILFYLDQLDATHAAALASQFDAAAMAD
jgi:outer membrane protein TolC